jgi:hypothetical protein
MVDASNGQLRAVSGRPSSEVSSRPLLVVAIGTLLMRTHVCHPIAVGDSHAEKAS